MSTTILIALILIGLGGIGGILLVIGQANSSSIDKADIINTTKNKNNELKEQIVELKNERKKLNKNLKARDNRIQKQQKKIKLNEMWNKVQK